MCLLLINKHNRNIQIDRYNNLMNNTGHYEWSPLCRYIVSYHIAYINYITWLVF